MKIKTMNNPRSKGCKEMTAILKVIFGFRSKIYTNTPTHTHFLRGSILDKDIQHMESLP